MNWFVSSFHSKNKLVKRENEKFIEERQKLKAFSTTGINNEMVEILVPNV